MTGRPGYRELGKRTVSLGRERRQTRAAVLITFRRDGRGCRRIVVVQSPAGQGIAGQDGYAVCVAIRDQIVVMASIQQGEGHLQRADRAVLAGLDQTRQTEVGQAAGPDFSLFVEPIERIERLGDRRVGVGPMALVQVDRFDAEPTKAGFAFTVNALGRQAAR